MSSTAVEEQYIVNPDPDGSRPFPEGLDQSELRDAQEMGISVTPEQMKAAPPPGERYPVWYYLLKAQLRHAG